MWGGAQRLEFLRMEMCYSQNRESMPGSGHCYRLPGKSRWNPVRPELTTFLARCPYSTGPQRSTGRRGVIRRQCSIWQTE